MEPHNIPEQAGCDKSNRLYAPVFPAQIKNDSENQGGGSAIHNIRVARQNGKCQNGYGKGEQYWNQDGGKTTPPLFP